MPAPRPLSVLVVENKPAVAGALAATLRDAGYETRTACCGEEALRLSGVWRPDVALLDLDTPGLGGLDLATRLKAWREPRPLLIAMTAGPNGTSGLTAESVFDILLAKPVDTTKVLRLLARFE